MSDFKKKVGGLLRGEGFSAGAMTALIIAVVIVFNVILYTVVEMFGLYLHKKDSTDLSLSGSTDTLFAEAVEKAKIDGKKVKISFCYKEDEVKEHSTGSFVYTTAKNFEARYPDLIELDFIDIIKRKTDSGRGELIEDFDKYKTDMYGNETMILKNSVIFEYGNNYRVITDTYSTGGFANFFTLDTNGYATAYNGEEVMAGVISWVLSSDHKTAYFTQYHGEIADLAFSNLLASAGYFVNVVDLRREEIPEDADLVVISNPTSDFERSAEGSGVRSEIDRLADYLDRGGNLFVALDPYVKKLPVLEGFLSEAGISFASTEDKNGKLLKNLVKDPRNAITTDGFTLVTDYAGTDMAKALGAKVKKYNKDGNVIVSKAAALEIDESRGASALLLSSSASVAEAGGKTVNERGSYCIAAASERDTDGGKAKIFVISSIYLAVSDSLITNGYSNRDFVYALLDEFYGAGKVPYGCKVSLYDTTTLENLKLGTAKIYTALIMAVPLLVAVTGAVVIVRRKNR